MPSATDALHKSMQSAKVIPGLQRVSRAEQEAFLQRKQDIDAFVADMKRRHADFLRAINDVNASISKAIRRPIERDTTSPFLHYLDPQATLSEDQEVEIVSTAYFNVWFFGKHYVLYRCFYRVSLREWLAHKADKTPVSVEIMLRVAPKNYETAIDQVRHSFAAYQSAFLHMSGGVRFV